MSRILIVEDDPAIGCALEGDLRLEGYAVTLVTDGDAAVSTARADRFDLILLDVMLPKKDRFDVCRELRRQDVDASILMLTARTAETEKVLGLDLGADDYSRSPILSQLGLVHDGIDRDRPPLADRRLVGMAPEQSDRPVPGARLFRHFSFVIQCGSTASCSLRPSPGVTSFMSRCGDSARPLAVYYSILASEEVTR